MRSYPIFLAILISVCFNSCQKKQKTADLSNSYTFRPNILWITCEDMSPHLGCYGDTLVKTPTIDRLAAESIRFTNVYSVSGVCAPSRSAIITGMYPTTTGAMHMRTMTRTSAIDKITDPELLAIPTYEAVPPPEVRCFTEYLRMEGYYCSNNSKEDYQFRAPVTVWDESSNTAHWRNRKSGQSFFAVFNFGVTHESQVWARADEPLLVNPDDVSIPPYYPDTPVIRKDIARHYTNIQLLDGMVKGLIEQLEAEGLMDSTIIFFYSDHGDGLPRAKRWIYDSGIKIPLIIRYPDGREAGSVNDELISFIDFAPTVLSLLDIQIPDHIQGQAFLGNQKAESREHIFAARDRMDPAMDNQRGVRDKRYKFIRNYMPDRPYVQFLPYRDQMPLMQELLKFENEGKLNSIQALWFRDSKPHEELYDTWNDPHEVKNLAQDPEYTVILDQLRQAHLKWKEDTDDRGMIPERELIKKLWPPDGIQPVTAKPEFEFNTDGRLILSSSTEGASIGYKINDADVWEVYHEPVDLAESDTLRAVAHRIGYKPSDELIFQNN